LNNQEIPSKNSGLSLADHITLELRADIIGGRLLPGELLPVADACPNFPSLIEDS